MSDYTEYQFAEIGEDLVELGEMSPGGWICRDSTCGRGLRLHQTTAIEFGPTFETPQEALKEFLKENDQ